MKVDCKDTVTTTKIHLLVTNQRGARGSCLQGIGLNDLIGLFQPTYLFKPSDL